MSTSTGVDVSGRVVAHFAVVTAEASRRRSSMCSTLSSRRRQGVLSPNGGDDDAWRTPTSTSTWGRMGLTAVRGGACLSPTGCAINRCMRTIHSGWLMVFKAFLQTQVEGSDGGQQARAYGSETLL